MCIAARMAVVGQAVYGAIDDLTDLSTEPVSLMQQTTFRQPGANAPAIWSTGGHVTAPATHHKRGIMLQTQVSR
jgi:hypothetical protein